MQSHLKLKENQNIFQLQKFENDIYNTLRNSESGDKAAFALDLLFLTEPEKLKVPKYIEEGLNWLQEKLFKSQQF